MTPIEIKLTKGFVALIDKEDLEQVTKFTWCASVNKNKNYVLVYRGATADNPYYILSRFLLKPLKGQVVDHIDGNPLNNCRSNLRIANQQQNTCNNAKRKNTSSIYKGVCWAAREGKWLARVKVNKKDKFLGYFELESDAGLAYNKAAIEHYAEFAKLNQVELPTGNTLKENTDNE